MDLKCKYAPKIIEDFIISNDTKKKLLLWRDLREFPNLIFYGPVGVGKSSLAKVFVKSIIKESDIGFEDYLFLHCLNRKIQIKRRSKLTYNPQTLSL